MTLPSIRELERRLSTEGAGSKATSLSIKDAVLAIEDQALERICIAEERQKKAEDEAAALRKEVDRLQLASGQVRQNAQDQINKAQDQMIHAQKAAMLEMEEMRECHKKEMQTMRSEADALKKQLASEQQARVKAESQLEVTMGMNARMEKMVTGLKLPVPVIQNNAAPPRSATATVTKRDGNGRIVSFSITQSS